MRKICTFLSLIMIMIGLASIIQFKVFAQSSGNETFPMAEQRIATKDTSNISSGNETFPMAEQRIATKDTSNISSGNETFPMAERRVPAKP
jgi:hypothetical protein